LFDFDKNMAEKIVRVVKWIKPSSPVLKLSTDESCINGTCGGGGVLKGLSRKS